MCSYNLINGTYACENDALLNGILKREMGFQVKRVLCQLPENVYLTSVRFRGTL